MKRTVFPFVAFVIFGHLLLAKGARAADPTVPTTGSWASFGNGPAHSGFYPGTLGSGSPEPGWVKSFSSALNQVAVSDGRVFVGSNGSFYNPYRPPVSFLASLDVTTGNELWRLSGTDFGAPVVADGHVFLRASPFRTVRAADGTTEWERDNIYYGGPPVAVGDHLWVSGSASIARISISDNVLQASLTASVYGNQHSVSSGILYIADQSAFSAADAETYRPLWAIATPVHANPSATQALRPAVAAGRAAFVVDTFGRLVVVDLKRRTILWSVARETPWYWPYPVWPDFPVANDGSAVYLIDGPFVKAFAANTGALLGRYDFSQGAQNPPPVGSQPIVTNDSVIVATTASTFIFDKATFQLRAELPVGGYLSYAAGILYVADHTGKLSTFRFPNAVDPLPSPTPPAPPPEPEPKDKIELASINRQGTGTSNGNSVLRNLSTANGRYVLFGSTATDLTNIPDDNGQEDLYVRDLQTDTTELVTVNAAGTAAGNALGLVLNQQATITPDGRFVVFESPFTDLDPSDPNGAVPDVFVRDLQSHHTSVISVGPNGLAVGGSKPLISADGRYVVFRSASDQLAPATVPNNTYSVFVRDRETNQTVLASVDESGSPVAPAVPVALTKNGRFLLFRWTVAADGALRDQLFLRDLQTQTTQLITVTIFGQPGTGSFRNAKVTEDGRWVAFDSASPDLVAVDPNQTQPYDRTDVFLRDTVARTTTLINWEDFGDAWFGDMSADGMLVGFFGNPSHQSMFVWDRRTGKTSHLGSASALANNALGTRGMKFDRTGRFAIYESNGQVYLFDRQTNIQRLLSHRLSGWEPGNFDSSIGDMTDDGQTVLFSSSATDLVDIPDLNHKPNVGGRDIFVSTTQTLGALLNISTRGDVRRDDNTVIGGFVVTGTTPKKIVIRALGPSLQALGINNAVSDPVLELHDSSGALLASNDNWRTNQSEVEATGIPPSHDLESALVRSLEPGAYTVVVRGAQNSSGTGLLELYDFDWSDNTRLANISTRGFVGSGDQVMIAGFVAGGGEGGGATVVVRGLGPTLGAFGVAGALQNPMLELRDPNGVLVAANDDWRTVDSSAIAAAGLAPSNENEPAILEKLAPGPYTAIVRGKDNTTGVALVEIYHLK